MSFISLVIFTCLTLWLAVLGWYDACYRRLPDVLTLGGAAVFAVAWMWLGWHYLVNGLCGACIGVLFLLIPFFMGKAGAGDLKMLFSTGLLMGFPGIFTVLVFTCIAGFLLALFMLVRRFLPGHLSVKSQNAGEETHDNVEAEGVEGRQDIANGMPFGIALAIGTWLGITLAIIKHGTVY